MLHDQWAQQEWNTLSHFDCRGCRSMAKQVRTACTQPLRGLEVGPFAWKFSERCLRRTRYATASEHLPDYPTRRSRPAFGARENSGVRLRSSCTESMDFRARESFLPKKCRRLTRKIKADMTYFLAAQERNRKSGSPCRTLVQYIMIAGCSMCRLHESHGENNVQQNLSACSSAKLDCGSAKSEELIITFWPVQYICAAPCAHTQVQFQCLQPSCSQRPSSPQKVARIPHHAKGCANCCQGLLGLVDPRDWPSFQVAVSLLFDFLLTQSCLSGHSGNGSH